MNADDDAKLSSSLWFLFLRCVALHANLRQTVGRFSTDITAASRNDAAKTQPDPNQTWHEDSAPQRKTTWNFGLRSLAWQHLQRVCLRRRRILMDFCTVAIICTCTVLRKVTRSSHIYIYTANIIYIAQFDREDTAHCYFTNELLYITTI